MSDNVNLNPGWGGDVINAHDETGVKTQVVMLSGLMENGKIKRAPVTAEGHLEVALHSPRLPFGSINTESIKPVIQGDGVFGLNPQNLIADTGLSFGAGSNSGATGSTGNKLYCETGTTQYSFASIQSRRRLKYRAGQGVIGRFTANFPLAAANSILVAGFGAAESTLAFGYNGTRYGILYSTGGVREIHTFTVTTASTATNDYVMTLPNGATVNITATNNSSTLRTAYEISLGSFPGWSAEVIGSTVIFVANSSGNKSGSFSLAQPGAVTPADGNDAETVAGVATTDTWIYQEDWNGDTLDGSGDANNPSGFSINPALGNVYQIGVQYLGFGCITFSVETVSNDKNNPDFTVVHTIRYPNTSANVSLSQPNFPFLMAAYSAGSSTNVGVYVGSYMGGIEGQEVNLGPRMSYYNNAGVNSSTSAYTPIFTFKNSISFRGRANQTVIKLLNVLGAARSANGLTTFYVIKNATLSGNPNFTQFSSTSCTYLDTSASACSFSDNSQVIWSGTVSEAGNFDHVFVDKELSVQPGESITLAVRSVTATATCVGALNTREDQ